MTQYRRHLPSSELGPWLSDGGLETTLIFQEGIELPFFAAFDLLKSEGGRAQLARYYEGYGQLAQERRRGFILETPTWRASSDWGDRLGYDASALAEANRQAVTLMLEVRERFATAESPFVISGNLGPRGDGYRADRRMNVEEARRYHAGQIETFEPTQVDLVTAVTMNYVDEAIGVVLAARDAAMPVVISFTTETDGMLPSGETLADAITLTDAATAGHAAYFMLNCAHPNHFEAVLRAGGDWTSRLRGVRANASQRSHAELDESPELDMGDPAALAAQYDAIRALLPQLAVYGGCCGTDLRHIRAIAEVLESPSGGAGV
ncbi:MAG: homocysteine S-methyltransferase [Polyangiaceae bacterium]|jgi:S-methylmethionine-dependent homocysteine/selenocysteine methylase|nr:homocysteine S-methyltransferase [Polyangiaceae bacterium]